MSEDVEPERASHAETHTSSSPVNDQPAFGDAQSDAAEAADERPELAMTQCPVCDGHRFISKLLVYEETMYNEDCKQTACRQYVRAEFEFMCGECETILRTLPPSRRDYYRDVAVLAADRRAVLRTRVRVLWTRLARRLWAARSQVALVLTVLVVIALFGL